MVINFTPWIKDRKLNLVQVQTTSVCNARCICCPYKDSWYKKNPGYMSDDIYSNILNSINEYDPEFSGKFCPYLCNEPFADKNIAKRVQMAYDILNKPYIDISTNCGLLDKKKIDEIYNVFEKNDFYGKFVISHHGIDKESFERFMGIPYEKAYDNMVYLLQKFDGQMKMSIQNMAHSIDTKFRMNPWRAVLRYSTKMINENNINTAQLHTEPKVFHNRAGNVEIEEWDYDKIVRKIDSKNKFNCLRLMGCLHVIYTGEVILCCMDYFRETIIDDLTKISVKEYFESENWKNMKGMVKGEIESSNDFICKRCTSPGG